MRRLLATLIATTLFALLAGWSVHRDSPQGLLRDTAEGCLSVSHGFSSLYLAILGVAGGMAVVLAITAFIASELGLFESRRTGLRGFSRSCLIYALGLAVFSLMRFPIESALPLQAPPANACPPAALR
jgi:hypothetical protein